MSEWRAGSKRRRLLAHLTSPLVASLLAALLFPGPGTFLERLGVYVPGAVFIWLMLGWPAMLLTNREPRKLWVYLAYAGMVVGLPIVLVVSMDLTIDLGLSLSYVTIAVVAACWYWFCADWQPRWREGMMRPE